MPSELDNDVAALTAEVANDVAVMSSATKTINGISGIVSAAVDKALAAGATPTQLKPITDAVSALNTNAAALSAAIVAATPAAPPSTGP